MIFHRSVFKPGSTAEDAQILTVNMQLNFEQLLNISPTSLVLTALTVLIAVLYYNAFVATRGSPPGPTGIPILGYWPLISNEKCGHEMEKLKKIYGDIFSVNFCGRLHINLGSIKAIREAHITNSDCFAGRVSTFSLIGEMFNEGVAFTNGESWKVQRKFFLNLFREYGLTTIKENMSGSLSDSVKDTVQYLRTTNGEPVNIIELLTAKCNNVLRLTLFGENITEEQINKLNEHYAVIMASLLPKNMLLTGLIARLFSTFDPTCRASFRSQLQLEDELQKIIDDHKSTYSEDHMRDIIDEYIKERNERKKKGDATAKYFTDKALVQSLHQFIGDGVLSVAAFIGLFFQALVEHPEEQEKIFQEIMEVVGDREPSVEDKGKLSYTNAFMYEVLRTIGSEFFPFFPSLECTKETTIRGYRIPKGSVSLFNIWSINQDPDTYAEPQKFNPSRFIATEGKKREELPTNFGVGKRACLGEGFVMMQIFMFMSTIVKHFRVTTGNEEDEAITSFQLVMSGKVRICVTPRVKG